MRNKYIIPLSRGYSCEVLEEIDDVGNNIEVIGNYSKSDYNATAIVNKNGIAPCVRESHGQVTGILVEKYIGEDIGESI